MKVPRSQLAWFAGIYAAGVGGLALLSFVLRAILGLFQ